MKVKILCKYDELVGPKALKPHPKNRNKHPKEQVERLKKLIEYQGVRAPIIVSSLSKFIVKGHGTLLAMKEAGMKEFPVVYQDFADNEQEYAFLQSDNAITGWAELDYSGINNDLADLGPDFDLENLGIKNFALDVAEKFNPNKEWAGMPEFNNIDKTSYRHVIVHFDDQDAVEKFFKVIGQKDTGNTKSIWYPPQKNMDTESKRYG